MSTEQPLSWLASTLQKETPSDWHLTPGEPLRVRVNGCLRPLEEAPVSDAMILEIQALAPASDDELDVTLSGVRRRFRVHRFQSRGRSCMVLRHIPVTPPKLETIDGVPVGFIEAMRAPQGLFLLGGATGDGKSTTMAAVIDRINSAGEAVIVTAENPIEFEHIAKPSTAVYQLAYGRDFTSWADALKDALRKDPDVIVLGELRDPETIYTALLAANTGHQIFATVHGGDAATILDRIVTAFPNAERQTVCAMLASAVRAVLAQRLVKTTAGSRTAIFELLLANQGARVTIRDNRLHHIPNVIAEGQRYGMQTLDAHIERLLARRAISPEEAKIHHSRPHEI